ncbi:MAG: APC family permease [Gemmatimonadaceae bacterium]
MPARSNPPPVMLPRALGVRDLVLLNLVAVTSLRWMATSAAAGPSALSLWVLAGIMFFVPLGLAVSEMSVRQPDQGGIYAWTKRSFGEGHGFVAGWCYWINNVLYPANLLISTAAMFTYAIGRGGTGLESDWTYVLAATLVMLWVATFLNIVGLKSGKWLQNVGAIATYLPGLVLIALGVRAMLTQVPANDITLETITPDLTNFPALNLWASVAFAFTGIELSATMADEIKDPRRSLPRAVLISAVCIAIIYLVGTLSVLWLVPSGEVNVVSGFLQSIQAGTTVAGVQLAWLVPICALLYTIGNVGGVGAWLIGPARVAFMIGIDRYFPPVFGAIHPKWKTPHVALLVQAGLSTVFLLLSVLGRGTTVERAYLILLDTMLLIYFIPFIYLFLTYVKVAAAPGEPRRPLRILIGISGVTLTLFAMVVACIPPAGTPSILVFELKVLGGSLGFVLVGLWFYFRGARPASP